MENFVSTELNIILNIKYLGDIEMFSTAEKYLQLQHSYVMPFVCNYFHTQQIFQHYHLSPPDASISSSQNHGHLFVRREKKWFLTSMSRQADLSRVIWSAMVRVVKPGSRLANSTILMMHLVESSLNLSHRPRSSWTRWSELEF